MEKILIHGRMDGKTGRSAVKFIDQIQDLVNMKLSEVMRKVGSEY